MRRRLAAITAILLFFAIFSFFVFEWRLYPIIEKAAVAKSRNLATSIINSAIHDCLASGELAEGDFVKIERGEGGEIVSLTADARRINLVKARVSQEVERRLSLEGETLEIPIGNLTGVKMLSGLGPKIRVKTTPARSVLTDIGSVFVDSGINQTWHRVVLSVDADFGVMVLSRSIECSVSDSVVLSDTVIVGRVPDAYTDINKIEDELLGDVVDFSASLN